MLVRPLPIGGISSASASSSVETTLPITVGTSSSETRIVAPKHSASSDKSIRLTDARLSVRSATSFMPFACTAESLIKSFTLMPISWIAGKERIGNAFFTGEVFQSSIHFFISLFIAFPLFLSHKFLLYLMKVFRCN